GFARERRFEETAVALSLLCALEMDVVERALLDQTHDLALIVAKLAAFSSTTAKAVLLLKAANRGMSTQDLDQAPAMHGCSPTPHDACSASTAHGCSLRPRSPRSPPAAEASSRRRRAVRPRHGVRLPLSLAAQVWGRTTITLHVGPKARICARPKHGQSCRKRLQEKPNERQRRQARP